MRRFNRRRDAGYFLIVAMMIFVIMGMMLYAAMYDNMLRRKELRAQKEALQAFYLAESGVQETIQRLARGSDPLHVELVSESGRATVHCEPVEQTQYWEIVSIGQSPADGPGLTRRIVVRVWCADDVTPRSLRVESWTDR